MIELPLNALFSLTETTLKRISNYPSAPWPLFSALLLAPSLSHGADTLYGCPLVVRQSLSLHCIWMSESMLPRKILNFRSSKITGNASILSIYFHKSLLNFALQNKSLLVIGRVIFVALGSKKYSILRLVFRPLIMFASL